MREMRGIYIWLLPIVVLMISCGRNEKEGPLTIATAANMQFAMEDMIRAFEVAADISCELVVSSSGKLTAQIHEGAPFDILISADMKYPEDLYRAGLTETPPQVYAYGKLVLWSLQDSLELSLQALKSPNVRHVALANPETAPYGKAALEVLQYHGIYEEVREKLVFGESIAQTNQFIISKAAEAGFTAMSVVLAMWISASGGR